MNEYTVFRCELCGQERDKDEYGEPDTLFRDGKELSVCCVCYDSLPPPPTPGPWRLCADGINVYAPQTDTGITKPEGWCGAQDGEARANARLIACAPELLSACEMMLRLLEGENLDEKFDGEAEVLRDAIRRARGEEGA